MNNEFIHLIDVKTDDTTDYKETSLLLITPICSGKCGTKCQNYNLIKNANIKEYKINDIVDLYQKLNTHKAVVFAGLEPMDSFDETLSLVKALFLAEKSVTIILYTGYYSDEIQEKRNILFNLIGEINKKDNKIIIKYGPYKPEKYPESYYSDILGVKLATNNQYVECVSTDYFEHESNDVHSNAKFQMLLH